MSVSKPVLVWSNASNRATSVNAGASTTVTVNITQEWEIVVPVQARWAANVSLDAAVFVYRSADGGASFDTVGLPAFSIPTSANNVRRTSVKLSTGQYAIEIRNSSPATTFQVLTQQILQDITSS